MERLMNRTAAMTTTVVEVVALLLILSVEFSNMAVLKDGTQNV